MSIEAMKLALEALNRSDYLGWQFNIPVMKVLRQAIAEAEQLNVADGDTSQDHVAETNVNVHEPVTWRNAAIRVGEDLCSVGPFGYYDMTAEQWLDWAMEQQPHGKNSLVQPEQEPVAMQMDVIVVNLVREGINKHRARELAEHFIKHTSPPQRQPMTDEEIMYMYNEPRSDAELLEFARDIEASHGIGEKNDKR